MFTMAWPAAASPATPLAAPQSGPQFCSTSGRFRRVRGTVGSRRHVVASTSIEMLLLADHTTASTDNADVADRRPVRAPSHRRWPAPSAPSTSFKSACKRRAMTPPIPPGTGHIPILPARLLTSTTADSAFDANPAAPRPRSRSTSIHHQSRLARVEFGNSSMRLYSSVSPSGSKVQEPTPTADAGRDRTTTWLFFMRYIARPMSSMS